MSSSAVVMIGTVSVVNGCFPLQRPLHGARPRNALRCFPPKAVSYSDCSSFEVFVWTATKLLSSLVPVFLHNSIFLFLNQNFDLFQWVWLFARHNCIDNGWVGFGRSDEYCHYVVDFRNSATCGSSFWYNSFILRFAPRFIFFLSALHIPILCLSHNHAIALFQCTNLNILFPPDLKFYKISKSKIDMKNQFLWLKLTEIASFRTACGKMKISTHTHMIILAFIKKIVSDTSEKDLITRLHQTAEEKISVMIISSFSYSSGIGHFPLSLHNILFLNFHQRFAKACL